VRWVKRLIEDHIDGEKSLHEIMNENLYILAQDNDNENKTREEPKK